MKQFMKKALMSLCVLGASSVAHAGTDSASITLIGYLTEVVDATLNPAAGYDNLDLSGAITNQTVATLDLQSNAKDGFTVTLVTANDLNLVGTGAAGQALEYTLQYTDMATGTSNINKVGGGGALQYVDGVGVTLEDVGSQATATNATGMAIAFSYSTASALWEPSFEDTLTVTITSK